MKDVKVSSLIQTLQNPQVFPVAIDHKKSTELSRTRNKDLRI